MATKRSYFRVTNQGFTIVELLVVIVVVGVLSTITIVAYNGIQLRARNTVKGAELMAWSKMYETYRAIAGTYPPMPDGGYCLGTGFADTSGDSIGDCRDIYYAPQRYSENTTLNNMLKTVGSLPTGIRFAVHGTEGPYVEYSATEIVLIQVLEGSEGSCPGGSQYLWDDDGGMVLCGVILEK